MSMTVRCHCVDAPNELRSCSASIGPVDGALREPETADSIPNRLGDLMILDRVDIDAREFTAGTGWEIKPEGACMGDVCVPLQRADDFDLRSTAERLRMALVHDAEERLWALGPASLGNRALASAEAPDLSLPDFDDNEFRLSSLRGQKVVLVSWAPY
jgi:hypothetical protein